MNKLIIILILSIIIGISQCKFTASKDTLFFEDFSNVEESRNRWIKSKKQEYTGIIDFKAANDPVDPTDNGLVLAIAARKYAVTYVLDKPIENKDRDLIVQYELQFQQGVVCSGGYIKLYTDQGEQFKADQVESNTPYSIMFGADVCGSNDRIHFIVRHKNPFTGVYEEKLITAKPAVKKDKLSHVYTLVIKPDNTFNILVDNVSVLEGDFHESFTPAFNPPKQIDDPSDSKPLDWVNEAKIAQPGASKPDDWDESQPLRIVDPQALKPSDWLDNEPLLIADPSEQQPSEWNEEDDGEWEAPMIDNPACKHGQCGQWEAPTIANPEYKGKWSAPMIDNPAYIGEWSPKKIDNPQYYNVENPYIVDPIIAVGVEVLTNTKDILFDNFIITHNKQEADQLIAEEWSPKFQVQKEKQAIKEAEEAKKLGGAAGDDILSQVQFYFDLFKTEADQNPLLYIVAFSSLILPLVFCFTRSATKKQTKPIVASSTESPSSSSTTSTIKESIIQDEPAVESDDSDSEDDKKSTVTKRTNKVK